MDIKLFHQCIQKQDKSPQRGLPFLIPAPRFPAGDRYTIGDFCFIPIGKKVP